MKSPALRVTRADVRKAQSRLEWQVGNEAIYKMCREHRGHADKCVVASKVWLIGRSYAASIERFMNADVGGEDFILKKVAPRLLRWHLDKWLDGVPRYKWAFVHRPDLAVTIHGRLLQRLKPLLARNPRSFASKYLHFHHRELFPIYDSRAVAAIRLVTPDSRQIDSIRARAADEEYLKFCTRLRWLLLEVQARFGVRLALREVDNLLLAVHRRASSV